MLLEFFCINAFLEFKLRCKINYVFYKLSKSKVEKKNILYSNTNLWSLNCQKCKFTPGLHMYKIVSAKSHPNFIVYFEITEVTTSVQIFFFKKRILYAYKFSAQYRTLSVIDSMFSKAFLFSRFRFIYSY